jgi:hypothetical protein
VAQKICADEWEFRRSVNGLRDENCDVMADWLQELHEAVRGAKLEE